MDKPKEYIPALSSTRLTPLYDLLMRLGMREDAFKRRLVDQAGIQPGMRLLDLGCGTGTLVILAKRLHPEAEIVGLDGDPEILAIARAKAAKAGVDVALDHSLASQLPYPDGSFDRVLTSLVIHHLSAEDKRRAMAEVCRVLRPGGEFHIADFGPPRGVYARLVSSLIRRLERAEENLAGLLPGMLHQAGFEGVEETAHYTTVFGTLVLLRGRRKAGV
jgi:ubiquinone/menaquinone biosynthesis C-methylase UbiE